MLGNYLKVSLRSLWKNRLYSTINVLGLSIGITVSSLIILYLAHELSYDNFHERASRIFTIDATVQWGGQLINTPSTSAQFGPQLMKADPNVDNYVRIRQPGRVVVHSDLDHKFFEDKFIFVDSSFFSVFNFVVIEGSASSLGDPMRVVITQEMKIKYFGEGTAIGKYLTYNNKTELEVVGIVAPAPSNSSLQFDMIASFGTLGVLSDQNEVDQFNDDEIGLGSYITYILVHDPNKVDNGSGVLSAMANSPDETFTLKKIRQPPDNIYYLKLFGGVAVLVLLLALVNYMNLTTSRAQIRAKEVGVRKVIGASRGGICLQFYFESALITSLAFICAYIFIEFSLPYFQTFVGQHIDYDFYKSGLYSSALMILFVFCILSAGSYPAVIISKFNPLQILKGSGSVSSSQSQLIRKFLMVFQFAVSIGLSICALIIQQQLEFLMHRNTGMNKESIMIINVEGLEDSSVSFRNEIANHHAVEQVAQASVSLFRGGLAGIFTVTPTTQEDVFINQFKADANFFELLEVEWLNKLSDTLKPGDLVINEAGINKLKIPDTELTQPVQLFGDTTQIAAVAKDFNFSNLKRKIDGLVINIFDYNSLTNDTNGSGAIYIKLKSNGNIRTLISEIESMYERFHPVKPFEFYFLEDAFQEQYSDENNLSRIFKTFTNLAIVIACLGLFGLVTFTTERRTKEIGIRKVFGASVKSILLLILKEYVPIGIISLTIAIPVAWISMENWLSDFPYRIAVPMFVFIAVGVSLFILSGLTIMSRAIGSAKANPIDSLRNE